MRSTVVIAVAWALAGCLDDPGSGGARTDASLPGNDAAAPDAGACDGDSDGDGYVEAACASALPADCDDGDPGIHPGAFDDPSNAVDEDCLDGPLEDGALAGNEISEDVGSLTVQNGALLVTFSRAANYRPTELYASAGLAPGQNLLYAETAGNDERLAGANAFPTWFGWDAVGTPGLSHVTSGRAAVRFRVAWTGGDGTGTGATGDCGWCGDTYVTVLPDGRIHADEDLALESGAPGFVTAYIALHHDAVSHVTWSNNDGDPVAIVDQMPATIYDGDANPAAWTCAFDAAAEHVVGWSYSVPSDQASAGPRIFQSFGNTPQVALQFDWVDGGGAPLGTYRGNFVTVVQSAPAATPCAPVDALAAPVLDPPVLDVDVPARRGTGQIGDDDADGYSEGGGFFTVVAGDNVQNAVAFELNAVGAAVPGSMLVSIESMDFSHDPVVTADGERLGHGRDYLFHADPSGTVGWLFLGDSVGLANGTRIELATPE